MIIFIRICYTAHEDNLRFVTLKPLTFTRRQLRCPVSVSEALDGARCRVVVQHVSHVTPERDGGVVRVVARVEMLVLIFRQHRALHNCNMSAL